MALGPALTGGAAADLGDVPNPRFALSDFFASPSSDAWAITFLTTNFNASAAAGAGPMLVLDNATLWSAPSRAAAAPYIDLALSSVESRVDAYACVDALYPPDACMSDAAVAGFGAMRPAVPVTAAEQRAAAAARPLAGAPSNEEDDGLPVWAIVAIALGLLVVTKGAHGNTDGCALIAAAMPHR